MNERLIKLLAELMSGLSVPGSMGMLGTADKPWRELREAKARSGKRRVAFWTNLIAKEFPDDE